MRFYLFYLLSLPLGQQEHKGAILQAALASTDRVLHGKEQCQVGTTGGNESANATCIHQYGLYKTIYNRSTYGGNNR